MPPLQPADTLLKNGYVVTVDKERKVFTDGFVAFHKGQISKMGGNMRGRKK